MRWIGVGALGALGGLSISWLLMTISFAITPSGGPAEPRPMQLPGGSASAEILAIADIGTVLGALLFPVAYALVRERVTLCRAALFGYLGAVGPGALGSVAGPAMAGLVALAGFLLVLFGLWAGTNPPPE